MGRKPDKHSIMFILDIKRVREKEVEIEKGGLIDR